MRNALVSIALAATAAVALPGAAAAAFVDWTAARPAGEWSQIAPMLELARAAWPGSPCAGRELVVMAPGDDAGAIYDENQPAAWGLALPWACTVAISADLSTFDTCMTLVHEFGHLAGQTHDSQVPVMHTPAGRFRPCTEYVKALRPRLRLAMRMVSRYYRAGHIRCTTVDLAMRCRARRSGHDYYATVILVGGWPLLIPG